MKRLLVALAVSVAGVTAVVATPKPAAAEPVQAQTFGQVGYLLHCVGANLFDAQGLQGCIQSLIDHLLEFVPIPGLPANSTATALPGLPGGGVNPIAQLPSATLPAFSLPNISTLVPPSLGTSSVPAISLPQLSNLKLSAPSLANLPTSITPIANISDVAGTDDSSQSPVSASDALVLAGLAGLAIFGGRKLRHRVSAS